MNFTDILRKGQQRYLDHSKKPIFGQCDGCRSRKLLINTNDFNLCEVCYTSFLDEVYKEQI